MNATSELLKDISIPKMFNVEQKFDETRIETEDIPAYINNILSDEKFTSKIKPDMSIAITAGSRGVSNVAVITKSIADFVKSKGAKPFVVPAMGSHGGGTAEGQLQILNDYGITEEYMGCPIRSSMEVVKVGVNEEGVDVYIDKNASEADGIIVSCRVKPHTAFKGPYESGIMKMMAIGLGKRYGADICHRAGFKHMAKYVPMFGKTIIKNSNILFAVASIENAVDKPYRIVAVATDDIEKEEPKLLEEAYTKMPQIFIPECDILVVDRIGKNYSGDGMDPNITGTFASPYKTGGLKSQNAAVLDLSEETHGNALGIGCATVIPRRLFDQIDYQKMYVNAITSTMTNIINTPMVVENHRECIQLCIRVSNEIDKNNPKIIRIANSLEVKNIMLSEALYEEAKNNANLKITSEPAELVFDKDGNLW